MKKIILLGAAPIDDVWRYPSEGSISVAPAKADELIKVGLAKADDLDGQKLADVREVAETEGVDIGPGATKPELVEAIRDRRANNA